MLKGPVLIAIDAEPATVRVSRCQDLWQSFPLVKERCLDNSTGLSWLHAPQDQRTQRLSSPGCIQSQQIDLHSYEWFLCRYQF